MSEQAGLILHLHDLWPSIHQEPRMFAGVFDSEQMLDRLCQILTEFLSTPDARTIRKANKKVNKMITFLRENRERILRPSTWLETHTCAQCVEARDIVQRLLNMHRMMETCQPIAPLTDTPVDLLITEGFEHAAPLTDTPIDTPIAETCQPIAPLTDNPIDLTITEAGEPIAPLTDTPANVITEKSTPLLPADGGHRTVSGKKKRKKRKKNKNREHEVSQIAAANPDVIQCLDRIRQLHSERTSHPRRRVIPEFDYPDASKIDETRRSALSGLLTDDPECYFLMQKPSSDGSFSDEAERVFVDHHEATTTVCVGQVGSGKTHSSLALLESQLCSRDPTSDLDLPLEPHTCCLSMNFDTKPSKIPEVLGLALPNPIHPNVKPPRVVVFTSPSNYANRHKTYPIEFETAKNVEIHPLLLKFSQISTSHLLAFLGLRQSDGHLPLYASLIEDLIRGFERYQHTISYRDFLYCIDDLSLDESQQNALKMRLGRLESYLDEYTLNARDFPDSPSFEIESFIEPGTLIVLDLASASTRKETASLIMTVVLSMFLDCSTATPVPRTVFLDEARRYLTAKTVYDPLSVALLEGFAERRHDNPTRYIISTQNPQDMQKDLLSLSDTVFLYSSSCDDWVAHVASVFNVDPSELMSAVSLLDAHDCIVLNRFDKSGFYTARCRPRFTQMITR